ncbi:10155_t:CDS:2 [Diversispora eburnea]|uniref:10155_t:CDS:1 n=1 Tax=Diversispora eburnea TaxID=1213867 RepID=A0A9N9CM39_9GLOM|nr:10155_t:CDS:2 [Diversispora eburnea]
MIFKSKFPDVDIPTTGIYQFVTSNPNKVPDDKVIFVDGITEKKLTFGELKRNTKKFAAGLIDKFNFKRGDVLALISPNEVDYPVVVFGTIAAGGKVTLVNPLYTANEFEYQFSDSNSSIIVVHPFCLSAVKEAAKKLEIPQSHILLFGDKEIDGFQPFSTLLISNNEEEEFKPIEYTFEEAKSTTAYLCYSSGTTGIQKGVETTHTNMASNVVQLHSFETILDSNSKLMGVLPFFHIYGLNILVHYVIYLGASTIILPKFDLSTFCRLIQDHKINYAHIVPPIVLLLVKSPIVKDYDLSSLQMVVSGAAPLSKELCNKFYASTKIPIKQGYGLTETSPVVTLGDDNIMVHAKVISFSGKGYNEPGELCVRGPNVMKGYLNNEERTKASFDKDGFYLSGDVVIVDEQENFFIVDRVKELIKYKGFQVAPAELEAILLDHPAVLDAAVIGVEFEEKTTEYPVAYVTLQESYEKTPQLASEIQEYVGERVAPHKRVRGGVHFIDKIPKSASGKILRKVLRENAKIQFS